MPKKVTTADFIKKAKGVHGDLYDYSHTIYTHSHSPVWIICANHGEFQQAPHVHVIGRGCAKCGDALRGVNRQGTFEQFIAQAREIHGDAYEYTSTEYRGLSHPIHIICKLHGVFKQRPSNHIHNRQGCPRCGITFRGTEALSKRKTRPRGRKRKSSRDTFIAKATQRHKGKYLYEKVVYIGCGEGVVITCPDHGDFSQPPSNHLSGSGCYTCAKEQWVNKKTKSREQFIIEANRVHKGRYRYEKVQYKKSHVKVTITCPDHGDFSQSPANHLTGKGCRACGRLAIADAGRSTESEFVSMANSVHKGKYSYDHTTYKSTHSKVIITCPEHGDFLQSPSNHLRGSGCSRCIESKGETLVSESLTAIGVAFSREYRIQGCRNLRPLPFDFVLFCDGKIFGLIEFQGGQHYKPVRFKGRVATDRAKKEFKLIQERDSIKFKYCADNRIPLLLIPYWKIGKITPIVMSFVGSIMAP